MPRHLNWYAWPWTMDVKKGEPKTRTEIVVMFSYTWLYLEAKNEEGSEWIQEQLNIEKGLEKSCAYQLFRRSKTNSIQLPTFDLSMDVAWQERLRVVDESKRKSRPIRSLKSAQPRPIRHRKIAGLGENLREKSTSFSPAKTQRRHTPASPPTNNPFRKLQGIYASSSLLT